MLGGRSFYIGHSAHASDISPYRGLWLKATNEVISKNQPVDTKNEIIGIFACGAQDYASDLVIGAGTIWYTNNLRNSGVGAAGLVKLVFCLGDGKDRGPTRREVQAARDTAAGYNNTATIWYAWWR